MATPNYAFEKRKKETAKKQKQQQKQQLKLATQKARSRDDACVALSSQTTNHNQRDEQNLLQSAIDHC